MTGDARSGTAEVRGEFGVAASTHPLATECAVAVLEAGGNAFDAAVAAGFVLQVAEPDKCGPGGDVTMVCWSARDERAVSVCGQGVAPRAATIARYHDEGLDVVPGTGLLAAVVPGVFDAWMHVLARWGTRSVAEVLAPAIAHARAGIPASQPLVATVRMVEELFAAHWPTSAALWLRGGAAPAVGEVVRLPGVAPTYERIVAEAQAAGPAREAQIDAARRAWSEGFVAEAIAAFSQKTAWLDTSGSPHTGLLDGEDLATWESTIEEPAVLDFGRYRVCKTGRWGQGPVFLQQLALLDALGIEAAPYGSAEYVHTIVEASKLAFADREAWYGDAEPDPALLGALLDPSYTRARAALVGERADEGFRPGEPVGRVPHLPAAARVFAETQGGASEGEAPRRPEGDTSHVDVADRFGNLVSATPSGGWLHSSPTIPDLGFCLTNRAQMFWLEPGLASSLVPRTRPRTTLSPSLAFRDGEPWLAFGTPGGDQQDQWSLAFFLAVVLGGLDLQEAVDAPAYQSEHFPSSFHPRDAHPNRLFVESRLPEDVVADLRRRGHDARPIGAWTLGRLSAVAREPDGTLRAAADARRSHGAAAGR